MSVVEVSIQVPYPGKVGALPCDLSNDLDTLPPPLNRMTDTCEKHYIPGPFLESGKNIKTVIYFQFLLSKEINI